MREAMEITLSLVLGLVFLVSAVPAGAADSTSNLGPSTSATPQYTPLGGFRRAGGVLRQHGRAELLFVGTQFDSFSAAARWPIVKALDQFGTWSHLAPSSANSLIHTVASVGDVPTFDFVHATYRSRYLTFVHKDTADRNGRTLQHLTARENAMYRRYVGKPAYGSAEFTMLAVGGYVMADSGYPPGDLQDLQGHALTFEAVQKGLQAGYQSHYVAYVYEIDAETNVLTALICHADGKRPRSVCGQLVIEGILKHVK
ncbi:MAG: DUF929 family protein [Chloroflexota bacterium]|nr:DUF929 family protein [Chloroflexota bacterium]